MQRICIIFVAVFVLCTPISGYTSPQADYEEAYHLYIAAGTSVAAYSDRIGDLARRHLAQDGWKIDYYVQAKGQTGARFILAQKPNAAGGTTYYVAIVGTESADDVKIDLKVDKVYFAGSNLAEFAANAAKQDVPDTEPKVHQGFHEFVQAGPSATLRNTNDSSLILLKSLLHDPQNKLYLTGHSLGGAAATLIGARLLSTGKVSPEQIEVISFGAPAIGNAAFAAKFAPVLHLTRVVNAGDPVTGVLQALIGGYKQFGREIKWDMPETVDDPHRVAGYLDSAIKNYYDKRRLAIQAGVELPRAGAKQAAKDRAYLVPLQHNLPQALTGELFYMREALADEYRKILPGFVIADGNAAANWREDAIATGCQWVIVPEVSATRLQREKNTYFITLSHTIYDVAADAPIDVAIFSTGTYNLTPLEAFIHTFKGVSSSQATWFKREEAR